MRQRRCARVLLVIGCLKNRSYTSTLTQGVIYCVCILKQWSPCWKNYMRAYAEVTQGVGLWLIEPSPKDIGGRVCREPPRIMRRSVTNVRDMP